MNNLTRTLALTSAIPLAILINANSLADSELAKVITEARQESQILTTYALNRHLGDHQLMVTVYSGVATLTGTVSEYFNRELAQQIALSVKGVTEVDNQIQVSTDPTAPKLPDERSYSEMVEDASITAAVKSKLQWSKYASSLSADVETISSQVTLTGTANNAIAKQMASLLASNTPGVIAVDNKLMVDEAKGRMAEAAMARASNLGQNLSDTWITTRVKSTLMYSSNVPGSAISVTTKDGIVTLRGRVANNAERALAVQLTNNVRGVNRVDARDLKHS